MPATYEPIATTTLSTAQSTITFSSLGSYTDVRLVISGTVATTGYQYNMWFNNDTTSSYSQTILDGDGATATSRIRTSAPNIYINDAYVVGGNSTEPSLCIVDIFSYAGSSTYKTILCNYNATYGSGGVVGRTVGLYRSTSAVTRIDINGGGVNMKAGTTATLYGIKAA